MSKRSKLRNSYYKKTFNYWKTMNTTATPTIEYVKWLENIILDNGLNEQTTKADTNKANLAIPVVSESFPSNEEITNAFASIRDINKSKNLNYRDRDYFQSGIEFAFNHLLNKLNSR